MLSPGRAAVQAAARASGIVLPEPLVLFREDDDADDDDTDDRRNNAQQERRRRRPLLLPTKPTLPATENADSPLSRVHDSVLEAVLARLDARGKCCAAATCRRLRALLAEPRHWRVLALGDDDDGGGNTTTTTTTTSDDDTTTTKGLAPPPTLLTAPSGLDLARLLARARGQVEALRLSGARAARDRERRARFDRGLRRGLPVPFTRGLRAAAVSALLGDSCVSLALDERASPLGGMTDDLARALAAHCPALRSVEVAFGRYSPPAELFTDEGVAALALGFGGGGGGGGRGIGGGGGNAGPSSSPQRSQPPKLQRLALVNCDRLTDRALYAAAAGWGATLEELEIGGYNEHVSDFGLAVLLEASARAGGEGGQGGGRLRVARLGARLPKVTDATGRALARLCGRALEAVALSSAMTAATLAALAAEGCPRLRRVDASTCSPREQGGGACAPGSSSSAAAADSLARLVLACPSLEWVRLPAGTGDAARAAAAAVAGVAAVAAAASALVVVVVDEEEEEERRRQQDEEAADGAKRHSSSSSGGGGSSDEPTTRAPHLSAVCARAVDHHHYHQHQQQQRRRRYSDGPTAAGAPPPSLSSSPPSWHGGNGGASFARPAPEPRELSCSPVFAFLTSEPGGWAAPLQQPSRLAAFVPPPQRLLRTVELRVAAPGSAGSAAAYDSE
jgi:hypothetical protein